MPQPIPANEYSMPLEEPARSAIPAHLSISQNVRQFLSNAGSTVVSVRFVKKDGNIRDIRFNPRDRKEIKGSGSKTKNQDIICVRDFDLARKGLPAWRSFNVNSIVLIRSRNKTFDFREVK